MKTMLKCLTLFISGCAFSASYANPLVKSSSAPSKSNQNRLLDKAWSLRNEKIQKKIAFIEQVIRENQNDKNGLSDHSGRKNMAIALIALSEDGTELAAAELFSEAAKSAPLKLSPFAAQAFWREFLRKLDSSTQLGSMALIDVAKALETSYKDETDASFSYFLSLAKLQLKDFESAVTTLGKIDPSSSFYRQAKLQEGLLLASLGKNSQASVALEMVASLDTTPPERAAHISEEVIVGLKERALINLARIHFEKKQYKESISLYRGIDAQSPLFYESISEQGWAFFMAGHPNRALGVGYGATSPYFNQQFQPDQYFLKAAVNYWLCDYSAARGALELFAHHSREDAKLFRGWNLSSAINQNQDQHEQLKAFNVIESLYLGVNQKNNLLGPKALQTLSRNTVLMNGLSEIMSLRKQRQALSEKKWPVLSKNILLNSLLKREDKSKINFGKIALSIIQKLKKDYEKSLEQMRIIHLEIMTAEKDKMMNSGRSVEGQQFTGTEQEFLEQFQENPAQLWADNKMEFWKDELDSFVFNKKSQCEHYEKEGKNNEG